MSNLKEQVDELNNLVGQFRFAEALDRFYADDIVSVENENAPTIGLPAYKESGKKFIANISKQYAKVLNVLISDNMTATEWHFKFDHKEWGKWDKIQLSVQRWKDGKIVHERHHYK